MCLFGSNNDSWIWIVLIILLVCCCGDNNNGCGIFGNNCDNGCC